MPYTLCHPNALCSLPTEVDSGTPYPFRLRPFPSYPFEVAHGGAFLLSLSEHLVSSKVGSSSFESVSNGPSELTAITAAETVAFARHLANPFGFRGFYIKALAIISNPVRTYLHED